jgi:hypothetical protein
MNHRHLGLAQANLGCRDGSLNASARNDNNRNNDNNDNGFRVVVASNCLTRVTPLACVVARARQKFCLSAAMPFKWADAANLGKLQTHS